VRIGGSVISALQGLGRGLGLGLVKAYTTGRPVQDRNRGPGGLAGIGWIGNATEPGAGRVNEKLTIS